MTFQRTVRLIRSPRGRLAVNLGSGALAIGVSVLAARHFASTGWPLAHASWGLVVAAGLLFLVGYLFKAFGWQRLFVPGERPESLALAAAGGAASVTGAALPGRFDDVVRIAVVRRYPGCPSGVGTLCLSLFTLGLIDAAALAPIAWVAAITSQDSSLGARAGLGVVAAGGIAAAVIVLTLPRIVGSGYMLRFRLSGWLESRLTVPREARRAWLLVFASWTARAVAIFLLLAALGFPLSFPLAIAFLCAAAASGALPIAPAGAVTQAGTGAAILMASGFATGDAVAFAVAAQMLLILAGAIVVVLAAAPPVGQRLLCRLGV